MVRVNGHSLDSSFKRRKMEISAFKIDNKTFEKYPGVHFDNILRFDYRM